MKPKEFIKLEDKKEFLKTLDMHQLWQLLVDIGKTTETKIANTLEVCDIHSILALIEFFNATEICIKQSGFDLSIPKYRIFDWLAMNIMGRNDDDRKQNSLCFKVLIWSYLKSDGNVRKFIDDLRETDYQCDNSYECITDLKEEF